MIFTIGSTQLRRNFGNTHVAPNRPRVLGTDVRVEVCVIAGTTEKVAPPTVLSARRDGS